MKRLLYLGNGRKLQSVAKLDDRFGGWGLAVDRYWAWNNEFPDSLDGYDGIFLSGSPHGAYEDVTFIQREHDLIRDAAARGIPMLGICFGSQILGRALGFGTYKLGYGHRGVNQPVLDRATGKVEVTSHNHGFAVDAPVDGVAETPFGRVEVSHVCLNDDVVEGLRALDVPAFTVQYHPEAAAGPHDADYLFDRFVQLIEGPRHA